MKIMFGGPHLYARYCTLTQNPVDNFLASQLDKGQIQGLEQLAPRKPGALAMMIDSGAFSVWNSGKTITKEEWLQQIIKIRAKLEPLAKELYFVNLDVIPGTKLRKPTATERVEAAEEGWRNYLWYKEQGIHNLVHVYHQYEPLWVLKRMLDNGCTYIGVSPDKMAMSSAQIRWLEHAFRHIPENEVRTHGFGVTALELISAVPWYSVDSISWVLTAGYGSFSIFSPLFENKMLVVKCSDRSVEVPIALKHRIEKYLASVGPEYTLESVAQSLELRVNLCVIAFLTMEKYVKDNPCTLVYKKQSSIFDF